VWWHAPVIPSYAKAEIRRTTVPDQPKPNKDLQDPISTEKKLGVVVCACHPSDSEKNKIGRLWSRSAWGKSETLSPK
jgi:hypothetical protein